MSPVFSPFIYFYVVNDKYIIKPKVRNSQEFYVDIYKKSKIISQKTISSIFSKKYLSNLKLSDFYHKIGERVLTCTFLNYVIINLVN